MKNFFAKLDLWLRQDDAAALVPSSWTARLPGGSWLPLLCRPITRYSLAWLLALVVAGIAGVGAVAAVVAVVAQALL